MARRRSRSWWGNEWYPPPSRPIPAQGGIRSQSQRGGFGASWWAKRWINVLESFDIGARLSRGRSYARRGQVLSIAIDTGTVKARVQGSRPTPYEVTIEVKALSESDWSKLVGALGQQAVFAAKLLAGEMPQDIEALFKEVGLSLFPTRLDDLKTACSCPDWSNPCKHIAAVYYLLGEEFDRDPFLLFTLRGLGRDALLSRLKTTAPAGERSGAEPPLRAPEPLSPRVDTFWGEPTGQVDAPLGAVEIPREPAALLRRLGGFPFWRAEAPLLDLLSPAYAAASVRGLDVFVGPAHPGGPSDATTTESGSGPG